MFSAVTYMQKTRHSFALREKLCILFVLDNNQARPLGVVVVGVGGWGEGDVIPNI